MNQNTLVDGSGNKTNDCQYCQYGIQKQSRYGCSPSQDAEFFRCERCGHCNSFIPITDDHVETEYDLDDPDDPDFPLVKTTFNRWKWRQEIE